MRGWRRCSSVMVWRNRLRTEITAHKKCPHLSMRAFLCVRHTLLIIEIPLMPVHQRLWRVELLPVDHRIRQHVLHILAGFVERDAFHPYVETQVIGTAQPLAHAAGAGVVGGGSEDAVAVELAMHLA